MAIDTVNSVDVEVFSTGAGLLSRSIDEQHAAGHCHEALLRHID